MPGALFAADVLDATTAIDEVMAEQFMLTPMMRSADKNAPDTTDSSRASVTLNAIFFDPEAKPMMPNSYDVREYRRPGVESAHPKISVSPSEIANQTAADNGVPFTVQVPDIMTRLLDSSVWRVSSIFTAKSGKLVLSVNLIG